MECQPDKRVPTCRDANECVPSGKWRKSTAFRQPSPATRERAKAGAPKLEERRRPIGLQSPGYGSASHLCHPTIH